MGFRDAGDASDSYANSYNHIITFTHIATGLMSEFKAFMTDFEDKYDSKWNDVDVYGRMDPISTFQGTKREISFAFDVVAASRSEALRNLEHSRRLVQSLYPVYEDLAQGQFSATSIQAPPLLRLKFSNLISDSIGRGLVGKLSGVSYKPDFEGGVFESTSQGILPKVNKFSCTFTVLHTEPLGFNTTGVHRASGGNRFPYYTTTGRESSLTPVEPTGDPGSSDPAPVDRDLTEDEQTQQTLTAFEERMNDGTVDDPDETTAEEREVNEAEATVNEDATVAESGTATTSFPGADLGFDDTEAGRLEYCESNSTTAAGREFCQ